MQFCLQVRLTVWGFCNIWIYCQFTKMSMYQN